MKTALCIEKNFFMLFILKEEILKRDGKILVRGDSGNPVDIICGTFGKNPGEIIEEYPDLTFDKIEGFFRKKAAKDFKWQEETWRKYWIRIKDGTTYVVTCYYTWVEDEESSLGGYMSDKVEEVEITPFVRTPEEKGTVELLWETFGGYINEKGCKVLDPHIGAIYGDSITPERAKEIYAKLEAKGFAANNCVLGIGSYTYQYNTRDTFGFALKATHAVINGIETKIFKEPKTDNGNFKKSQKGLCYVYEKDREILYKDELTFEEINSENVARINTPARIRMAVLYAVSAIIGGRVANTCNLSEDWVGYTTKFGDGAGDFSPIAEFTVTEVKEIGKELSLPDMFVNKVPIDGLCGKTDEENLGFSYEVLDKYIRTGICEDAAIKNKIDLMHAKSRHKFNPIPKYIPAL